MKTIASAKAKEIKYSKKERKKERKEPTSERRGKKREKEKILFQIEKGNVFFFFFFVKEQR